MSTVGAIESGIYYGVTGGINALITLLTSRMTSTSPQAARCAVFLTGGDALLLLPCVDKRAFLWPEMTLEGIRLTAEAQP
jgi:pantothenate kinase type III